MHGYPDPAHAPLLLNSHSVFSISLSQCSQVRCVVFHTVHSSCRPLLSHTSNKAPTKRSSTKRSSTTKSSTKSLSKQKATPSIDESTLPPTSLHTPTSQVLIISMDVVGNVYVTELLSSTAMHHFKVHMHSTRFLHSTSISLSWIRCFIASNIYPFLSPLID